MLIDKLLRQRRLAVLQLAEQGQQRQKLLHAQTWLIQQRGKAFIGSAPGLMLSFTAGALFQLRHNSAVKTVRSLVGLRWLRLWL
ncbi:hypothetical protein [Rheinheimera maricola]|uniref:Uncharacterized protein n=1 Tax=Rheinheimera maricola TaxID=2793282 RepID=A0ABS7X5T6_9GAMM|nr:hypothetical protein [Rheinheimera maricola]MBZ9609992.1 hypothetical protein [Rheinheimera maricola]